MGTTAKELGWPWRWATQATVVERARFHCPFEDIDAFCEVQRVAVERRLFRRTLLRREVPGLRTVCTSCGRAYDSAVRCIPTTDVMGDILDGLVVTGVAAVLRAVGPEPGLVSASLRLLAESVPGVDEVRLLASLDTADDEVLVDLADRAGAFLTDLGKRSVVVTLAQVLALADSRTLIDGLAVIRRVGEGMGLPATRVVSIVARISASG